MFTKILIANRGEIACRVARTARRDGDPHGRRVLGCRCRCAARRRRATRRYRLGPPAPRESYLNGDAILAIAQAHRRAGHPPGLRLPLGERGLRGGVRSRRARVHRAAAAAIAAMGSKSAAKTIMADAQRAARARLSRRRPGRRRCWRARPSKIGFPVLIKATAGGGGKGMKIVTRGRRIRGGARVRATRGQGLVRRRSRADRALPDVAAAHRDPGVRRHARRCRVSLRARLLGAAPAPEGAGGGARARHDARAPARDGRRGRGRREGHRLRRRRHRRVHRRAGRPRSISWK